MYNAYISDKKWYVRKEKKGEEKGFVQKVDVNAACRSCDNDRVHGGNGNTSSSRNNKLDWG